MAHINIRYGTAEDAVLITDLVKRMVKEMTLYGGHAVNESPEIWSSMAELVRANCARPEFLYLIASDASFAPTTVGMVAAYTESLENLFAAKTRLYLSAVYTIPAARRQGIARQLIQQALEWGQRMNASEADLNVLVANPARQIYDHLGFRPHEISMVKELGSDQAGT